MLSKFDLLIVLGADPVRMSVWSEVEPLPDGMPVVHIGLIDWDMGKNFAAEMAVRADLRETLMALTPLLRKQGGDGLAGARPRRAWRELAKENWTAKRAEPAARLEGRGKAKPIDPDWLSLQIANALPKDAVVVNEGLTSARHLTDLIPYRDRYGFHALASGGIGWGLPAAVGVALAQAPRPVCCFSRRRQRHVLDPGAVDGRPSQATDHLRHRQQRRLSHHQAAPASRSTATTTTSAWTSPIQHRLHGAGQVARHAGREHHRARCGPAALRRAFSTPAQAAGRRGRRPRLRPRR